MDVKQRLVLLMDAYQKALTAGRVHNKKEFAELIGVSRIALSNAMNENATYLTESLVSKAMGAVQECENTEEVHSVKLIPTGAMGGTISDFNDGMHDYDCEKVLSPVKGAELAIQVTGDSMSPEYPNGSKVLIKKINHEAFVEWGKVYVLDTENGALIKQVRKTDKPDVVECVSLNPAYQSFEVHTSYIRGWYRVLMMLALK